MAKINFSNFILYAEVFGLMINQGELCLKKSKYYWDFR